MSSVIVLKSISRMMFLLFDARSKRERTTIQIVNILILIVVV